MFLVFIVLILSTCLIPLILIDMRIKVSEDQFDIAVKKLESLEDNFELNIQKTLKNSNRISDVKMKIAHINKIMKWKIRSGYTWLKTFKNNEKV